MRNMKSEHRKGEKEKYGKKLDRVEIVQKDEELWRSKKTNSGRRTEERIGGRKER